MNLYKLDENESLCLGLSGDQGVIAAGPWSKGPGTLANRVVLRELDREFTVHRQVIPEPDMKSWVPTFCWGHYFPKQVDNAFERAWVRFEQKAREHQGLPGQQG